MDLLEKGLLDLSFLGSVPAVMGMSAPRNLPIEIVHVDVKIGMSEAIVVRPDIQTPDVSVPSL